MGGDRRASHHNAYPIRTLIPMGTKQRTRVLCVASAKGGVGKTSLATALAAANAARGRRTLLVDAEPQANAADATLRGLEGADAYGPGLADLIETSGGDALARAANLIQLSRIPRLDVLPPGALDGAARYMARQRVSEALIADRVTAPISKMGVYDLLVIDTAPSLGELTSAALVAASGIVAPLRVADPNAVRGVTDTLDALDDLKGLKPGAFLGVVLIGVTTKPSASQRAAEQAIRSMRIPILGKVRASEMAPKAALMGRTIIELAPKSPVVSDLDQVLQAVRRKVPA
jgi:chromosome partitioning protein